VRRKRQIERREAEARMDPVEIDGFNGFPITGSPDHRITRCHAPR